MWSAHALPRCSCQSSLQRLFRKATPVGLLLLENQHQRHKHWLPMEIFKIDVMFAYAHMYAYEFSLKEIILNKPKF